jgi:hypothetical protein
LARYGAIRLPRIEQARARSRHRFRQKLGFGRDKNKDVMITQTA